MPSPALLPVVSVLMPVRNGGVFLDAAISSILGQTLRELELIVIDDGSTDGSSELIAQRAASDPRIRVVPGPCEGVAAALNAGLAHATGEFLARMDSDDISRPQRFERQVAHLRNHPRCAVVGSCYAYIDSDGLQTSIRRVPVAPADVRAAMAFGNPIAHPSVMMNRALVGSDFRYRTDVLGAEDFVAWAAISASHELSNLAEVLVDYRKHQGSITADGNESGRRHAVNALVDVTTWPRRSALGIFSNTYNASAAGIGIARFGWSVVRLNLLNLWRPSFGRTALAKRSLVGIASMVRQRRRDRPN